MTLYKRGNIWWTYVCIDGERHAKSTGTANRRHAQTIGQAFEEELNLKRHQLPKLKPDMTVDELTALFIGEGLAKAYSLDRLQHVLPFFGSMTLGDARQGFSPEYRKERHEASDDQSRYRQPRSWRPSTGSVLRRRRGLHRDQPLRSDADGAGAQNQAPSPERPRGTDSSPCSRVSTSNRSSSAL